MNNLELSNPVAWTDADELADMDCNTYGNIFNAKYVDIHNGRWLPLYSQGYVDFLIAQLAAAEAQIKDMKEVLRGIHNTAIDPYGSRAGIAIAAKRAVLGDAYAE
ncbi:hypothetical protein ACRRQX_004107 [Yersinia enterocolitica]|uniref:hypothetical protein n=1 Tax=Yersinia enterocolitica TaxID=630 RepID=UPI0005E2749B|nr:hypothetical protein [Yersinia enterocolitica]CNL31214.1 Uncharacterised protein [Yersinia enterocolitica]HDL6679127.1 hypothetical protein [Yersinia enterocolitica]HDL8233200.1 hypothetical protein [Yersinia enterocolitica]HDX8416937.1 hypothetical protein [Yersinia enterocolitica]